ncbi:MAG: hypothetical protein D6725_07945 [Planctomycetota bacterium]|nr:MAG: hypothetical protein D6725_07945 [Planctomycetota bacterium]
MTPVARRRRLPRRGRTRALSGFGAHAAPRRQGPRRAWRSPLWQPCVWSSRAIDSARGLRTADALRPARKIPRTQDSLRRLHSKSRAKR